MNGALGVMLGSFLASWGMSALYFIVGMEQYFIIYEGDWEREVRGGGFSN